MKKTTVETPHTRHMFALLAALPLAIAGCTTEGTAIGDVESPAGQTQGSATFVWESDFADPVSGTISGTLPNGKSYSGRYYEIVRTATEGDYEGAWDGWDSDYWADWPSDDGYVADDWPGFVNIYTGRVIANLQSEDGQDRLRCRFTLADPTEGLAGGGSGECQGSDGEKITDVVLTSD